MPFIQIDNLALEYKLRRSQRAKRLHLICRDTHFEIVAPGSIKNTQALAFLWSSRAWLVKQHAKRTKRHAATVHLPPVLHVSPVDRERAKQAIDQILAYYCPLLQRWPTSVRLKKQKSRWGSCGIRNGITINERLIFAPAKVLEYVVVHELCHLWHRNHGKRFWAKVAFVMPDYVQHDRWLTQQGAILLREPSSQALWEAL